MGIFRRFTLLELLVVISIMAMLICILLPALSLAKGKAKALQCASNLKQCGIGFELYASDYNGYMIPSKTPPPPSSGTGYSIYWFDVMCGDTGWTPFINERTMAKSILNCPSDTVGKVYDYYMYYGMPGGAGSYVKLSNLTFPSRCMYMTEGEYAVGALSSFAPGAAGDSTNRLRLNHSGGLNWLLVDGHVNYHKWPMSLSCDAGAILLSN